MDPFITQMLEILPGSKSLRHIKLWQLIFSKLDIHMTSLCYFGGIFYGFLCIREKCQHFLLGFQIKLTALIPHTILVLHLMLRLDT